MCSHISAPPQTTEERPCAKLALAALVALAAPAAAEEKPELVIYTYESFVSEWGPGPQIAANFEEVCGCTVRFVGAGDGAALLGRLRLEGERTPGRHRARPRHQPDRRGEGDRALRAARASRPPALDLPIAWDDDTFLPYDWGYFAFVYDKTKMPDPPESFEELIASEATHRDPRSRAARRPGLGLLMWVKDAYGDRAPEIWKGLAPHVVTVAPGWSEAYGLFLDGEVDMALAYTTSPAYHLIAEDDDTKAAAIFEEGHYMQVEVAAMTAATRTSRSWRGSFLASC